MVMVIAACGASGSPSPSSTSPDIQGIDLIVSPTRIVAYVGFVEEWASLGGRFPQPGACAQLETDAVLTGPTCFGQMSVGAEVLSTQDSFGPANPFFGSAISADATLQIAACGASIEIPLHPGTYPAIDGLHMVASGNDVVVDWSASTATSVLVAAGAGTGLYACHETTATQHVFAGNNVPQITAEVQAFRSPEVTDTSLGPVRVWYGDLEYTSF